MARAFRGESSHKVDSKGRVSIPAAFRRVLEEGDPDWQPGQQPQVVLVYGGKNREFLEGYTLAGMADVDAKIAAMPRGTKARRALEHMFSAQSVQLAVDDTGRLVLSQRLRDKVGITGEAIFKASVETFQIWAPDTYETHAAALEDFFDDDDPDFDPLQLLDAEA
ncbi:MAG: division/cell wall cluster transcriptional repressor MraZ [Pseudomonadota bacterium]